MKHVILFKKNWFIEKPIFYKAFLSWNKLPWMADPEELKYSSDYPQ
jgi:hypothetical protein